MCADFIGMGLGNGAVHKYTEELDSRTSQVTRQTLSSWTGLCRIREGDQAVILILSVRA